MTPLPQPGEAQATNGPRRPWAAARQRGRGPGLTHRPPRTGTKAGPVQGRAKGFTVCHFTGVFPGMLSAPLPNPHPSDGCEARGHPPPRSAPWRDGTASPPLCLPAGHPRPRSAPLDRPLDFHKRPVRRSRRPPAPVGRPAGAERGEGGSWAAAGDGAASEAVAAAGRDGRRWPRSPLGKAGR